MDADGCLPEPEMGLTLISAGVSHGSRFIHQHVFASFLLPSSYPHVCLAIPRMTDVVLAGVGAPFHGLGVVLTTAFDLNFQLFSLGLCLMARIRNNMSVDLLVLLMFANVALFGFKLQYNF